MRVIESLLPLPLAHSLRFQETFYPLGFPLIVTTNSKAVLETARVEWDMWAPTFDEPPVVLSFNVSPDNSALPPAAEFHAHGHLFAFVSDARNLAVCDTETRSGTAWLTSPVAENPAFFRYHFLEAMALEMLVSLYLTPFHAGCVALDGQGVLLCGDSCSGKSSIAYACARRGWTYLSDDASYLIRARAEERLVLGHPHRVRLRPDAPGLFPELASQVPGLRGNGKLSLEIRTQALATARSTVVNRFVLLQRTPNGGTRLTPVEKSRAREICEPIFYWWDAEISAEQQATFDTLLEASEVFSLEYSVLDAAVDLMEKSFRR
jgi:hypothetical protein